MVEPVRGETKLCCGTRTFILHEEIARGGTSILYRASLEGDETAQYAIKEAACPNEEMLVRDGVRIHAQTPEAELRLKKCREAVIHEKTVGRAIATRTLRTVALWETLCVDSISLEGRELAVRGENEQYGPDGAVFALMQELKLQGRFLKDLLHAREDSNEPLTFFEIVRLIRHTAEALAGVHSAHYLFGDVSVNNIFCADTHNPQEPYNVYLIDFGCSRAIMNNGETETISRESLFSTEQYRAPEVAVISAGLPGSLTTATDIFSLGALLLDLLGKLPKERNPSMYSFHIDDALRERAATPAASLKCKELLRACMNLDPKKRPNIEKVIVRLNELETLSRPPEYLLNPNLASASAPGMYEVVLKNRTKELLQIDQALDKEGYAIIYGMGGIGKTQLAVAYAKSRFPGRAYRVFYRGSLTETIEKMWFTGFQNASFSETEIYQKKMDLLREQYHEDSLLILDDFYDPNKKWADMIDDAYHALLNLRMKILITTRFHPSENRLLPELTEPSLMSLVEYFQSAAGIRNPDACTVEKIRTIVKLLQRHPLSVDLAARCVSEEVGSVTLDELIDALEHLKSSELPEIEYEKDNIAREETIYGHLKLLFSLSDLSEAEKTVMIYACLFPSDGFNERLLSSILTKLEKDALRRIVKRSMLCISEDKKVSIHPLVKQIVIGEIFAEKRTMLSPLWDRVCSGALEFAEYEQACEVFYNAWKMFDHREDFMRAGPDWYDLDRFDLYELFDEYLSSLHPSSMKAEIIRSALLSWDGLTMLYEEAAECFRFFPRDRRTVKLGFDILDQLAEQGEYAMDEREEVIDIMLDAFSSLLSSEEKEQLRTMLSEIEEAQMLMLQNMEFEYNADDDE